MEALDGDMPQRPPARLPGLLRATLRLPVFDLNYLVSSERADLYAYAPQFPRRGILGCALVFCAKAARSALHWLRSARERVPVGAVVAAVETRNQRDALAPVAALLPEAVLVNLEAESGLPFPSLTAYLVATALWPLPWVRYATANRYVQRSYAHVFHHYWLTYGWYPVARMWLRRVRPQIVLVANDHNMKTRTLAMAAHDEGIPTAYLQHASVTDKFPPLNFDLAFLDGRDALEKYAAIGPAPGAIFLVGPPKYDAFHEARNRSRSLARLGVCTNLLDPTDRVEAVCLELRRRHPDLPLVLRPHPGDSRPWAVWAAERGITFSDARTELSFAFLRHVDAMVVSDSNIALEALLMNVAVIRYDFAERGVDHYGFLARRVVIQADSLDAVMAHVHNLRQAKPDVRAHARAYFSTIGTAYDGRSAELVATTLRLFLDDAPTEHPIPWRRMSDLPRLEAYDLAALDEDEPCSQPGR